MELKDRVRDAMIGYYRGDPKRIGHFLKVHGFARAIGAAESLDDRELEILEIAALTHDIGIKNSELKYGSTAGKYQELEGPPEAEKLLAGLDCPDNISERVKWLIARHHTYTGIEGRDYQILVEADFLVNAYEDGMNRETVKSVGTKLFKTKTGKAYLMAVYLP